MQLIDRFDPLPSDEVQKKIDFYFKPYTIKDDIRKHLSYSVNERDDYLQQLRQKLLRPETADEDKR